MTAPIGPGDVVVCVDNDGLDPTQPALIKDARYRVHWAGEARHRDGSFEPGVILEGMLRANGLGSYIAHEARRFRPLRDDDAEMFRAWVRDVEREGVA